MGGGSISALGLYFAGGLILASSLTLIFGPSEADVGPGLVGAALGVIAIGLGRVVALLTDIRAELRDMRS